MNDVILKYVKSLQAFEPNPTVYMCLQYVYMIVLHSLHGGSALHDEELCHVPPVGRFVVPLRLSSQGCLAAGSFQTSRPEALRG